MRTVKEIETELTKCSEKIDSLQNNYDKLNTELKEALSKESPFKKGDIIRYWYKTGYIKENIYFKIDSVTMRDRGNVYISGTYLWCNDSTFEVHMSCYTKGHPYLLRIDDFIITKVTEDEWNKVIEQCKSVLTGHKVCHDFDEYL